MESGSEEEAQEDDEKSGIEGIEDSQSEANESEIESE